MPAVTFTSSRSGLLVVADESSSSRSLSRRKTSMSPCDWSKLNVTDSAPDAAALNL